MYAVASVQIMLRFITAIDGAVTRIVSRDAHWPWTMVAALERTSRALSTADILSSPDPRESRTVRPSDSSAKLSLFTRMSPRSVEPRFVPREFILELSRPNGALRISGPSSSVVKYCSSLPPFDHSMFTNIFLRTLLPPRLSSAFLKNKTKIMIYHVTRSRSGIVASS